MLQDRKALLTGFGVGVALMYFLDPERGRRRRALVRDRIAHGARLTRDAAGATSRDLTQRASGIAASVRGKFNHAAVDDEILVERARARLGRLISHPRAVTITAEDGMLTLSGPILQREVMPLIDALERVNGVRGVLNELEIHKHAGSTPALQGGRSRPAPMSDFMQRHWSPSTRLLAGGGGLALTAIGSARRTLPGALVAGAGIAMLARAAANVEMRRLTGIGGKRRAVDVQKTITIDAPIGDVFAFWSAYENFPLFMSRVLDVCPATREGQSRWTVAGPAGIPVQFDAEVTAFEPDQSLGWRTIDGSTVAHAGLVRFEPVSDDQTRVHIRMSYNPPGGWIGHGIAAAFGVDPKMSLDADLLRMKTLVETGRPPHDAAQRETGLQL
ncbi:MAG TPA: SRPBCC family protein [Vicinamibacterales bacterium]|jgi:uncharacterized membrane protein|nr:SRPBCC family protein [Vicinamibacterales bacterium]